MCCIALLPEVRAAARLFSFDDLVGALLEKPGHVYPKRLGGLEVDRKLEHGRLLNWKLSGFGALEDFVDVSCGTPIQVSNACSVGHEPTIGHEFSQPV
jgi:hypothetical protein